VAKIRVSYSELKSDGCYNNRRAEAEIEFEVRPRTVFELKQSFEKAWSEVRRQVKEQLQRQDEPSLAFEDDDVPF